MKIHKMKTFSIVFCGIFSILFSANIYGQNMFRKMLDFDGDGKADFAVTRNVGGQRNWYILQSSNGYTSTQFGLDTDENITGDYDGDGKYDVGIFRKNQTCTFWILRSRDGIFGQYLNPGCPEFKTANQDYNNDGKTDLALCLNTAIWINSTLGDNNGFVQTPATCGNFIKIGDMTGNGTSDIATFDLNTHLVSIKSYPDNSVQTVYFGDKGDVFLPADFDGDGRGDISVWRPSTGMWWYIKSSDNTVQGTSWGNAGDVPVPADYDGDGKTDVAIWRGGAQSYYWVNGSQNGIFSVPWGIASDAVVKY